MISTESKIGEMVASDYRSASVFKKYGIDFCCGGGKTIDTVCEKKGINREELLAELMALEKEANQTKDSYGEWDLSRLVDYIIEKHHKYTTRTLADLYQYLTKVTRVHGDHNPELHDILKNFIELAEELNGHMPKEEMILFPYIKDMDDCKDNVDTFTRPPFGTIQNPIQMMENEHEAAGDNMRKIRQLSNNFTPPSHACNTYMVSFKLLEEFEEDLHKHIHLENNILFPRAIELEKTLLA